MSAGAGPTEPLDAAVAAVLGTYHARIAAEEAERGARPSSVRHGGPDDQLMRAVGPETGRLLNILARSLAAPRILELGTSFGYSGIWLADGARASGGRLTTIELDPHKSAFARAMAEKAGLAGHVDFLVGDAVAMIADLSPGVDLVLLDLWKDLYVPCLEAVLPKLGPGAILVADNMIRPGNADIGRYREAVRAVPGMRSLLLPIGSGLEISRYEP